MNRKILMQCPPARLPKQIIAMVYDSFLIASILFIATAILLPFNHGEALSGTFYSIYLLIIIFIFYSWFWNKSGQTLGMKVWKIRIIDDYGFNPSWFLSLLRLTLTILPPIIFIIINRYFMFTSDSALEGIIAIIIFSQGYCWRLFKPFTMHDHLSQTRIIDVSKIPVKQ